MVVTLQIDEPLASRLQAKAVVQHLSTEDFARMLLGEGLQRLEDSEVWNSQNQRRIDLIRKSSHETLTETEEDELQQLQEVADQRLEARDHELLAHLDRLKQAVNLLPDARSA
ncbi:hypothetical protein [Candidatus Entotheonella palauensis]|uniref:Uncharacterized protein n=1 Tax=Candidatus Entotheonella gemina TaxID=1429439 RepID=W4LM70_9BACT|nr:hypothetical protein [Candidatus Entotheonella palauensis]ETW99009.1 MAG: hypothetical protein ETSY2_41715 [Candidatus Entotheonella gemina]